MNKNADNFLCNMLLFCYWYQKIYTRYVSIGSNFLVGEKNLKKGVQMWSSRGPVDNKLVTNNQTIEKLKVLENWFLITG